MLYIVIYKGKKVVFSFKFLKTNGTNKIYINKFIKALYSFLLTVIIYLNSFGSLIIVVD